MNRKEAADMSIDLWAARLERTLTEQETERMMRILPPKRRERLMKLREDKRQEPLCAPFPKSIGTNAISTERNQSSTNSLRKRICRPITSHPGVQKTLRIYSHVLVEDCNSLFGLVYQSHINVPFVLSGNKCFPYFCLIIH